VVQDTRRAGRLLVEALINLIEGKPVHGARLPTHLIVRRSSVSDRPPLS
jgi:DNA-binding LacI/PurR family transcriptional regulator